MRDAGRVHGDAGRAIEEAVAVDVFDDGAFAAGDDERIVAGIRRRDELRVLLDDCLRLRAGEDRFYFGSIHVCVTVNSKLQTPNAKGDCFAVWNLEFGVIFSSTWSPTPCLRAGSLERRGPCGCGRLRQSFSRGARPCALRSDAQFPRSASAAAPPRLAAATVRRARDRSARTRHVPRSRPPNRAHYCRSRYSTPARARR